MGRPTPTMVSTALDTEGLRETFSALAGERFGDSTTLDAVAVDQIHRRILRYTLQLRTPRGPRTWSMVGKVHDEPEVGARAFRVWSNLWDQGFAEREPRSVSVPEPFAWLPELRLMLMEEVPGEPLKQMIKGGRATGLHARHFGQAMAKLHGARADDLEPFTIDDHLARRCQPGPDALAEAFPDLSEAIAWVLETARSLERQHGVEVLRLTHGDFHFGQANIRDERLWLLDLDPLNLGDPAYDLAMVFMVLKRLDRKKKNADYIRALRNEFLSAYFADQDYGAADRVPMQLALIHLKRACKRLRWQDEPGWKKTVRQLVRQTVACLQMTWPSIEARTVEDVLALYERCPGAV